jgi:hypothetical protein
VPRPATGNTAFVTLLFIANPSSENIVNRTARHDSRPRGVWTAPPADRRSNSRV